jgi:NAD(P)-dependent dehydrogenase (short-subunit alcohol dehydrogenase family)
MQKVAVVTGANRGMGFEASRQLATMGMQVILTSRDPEKGQKAAEQLHTEGLEVTYCPLDVANPESIASLSQFVREKFGRLDVLVNNAGLMIDSPDISVFDAKVDTLRKTMETNVYGPLQLIQALVPLMKEHDYGRIVNVSSGMGQLTDMGGGYPGYRLSKTSLNALTRIFADELKGTHILINTMCPGWVKTDMGGPGATRTPEQGVDTMVWLATLPDDGPTGAFFRDRKPIPW